MTHGRALLLAHISVFFMGIAAVLAEASGFEAWRTTAYRVTFGGLVLSIVLVFRPPKSWPKPKITLLFLGLGLVLSVHWFAFFRSIELLGVMLGSAMLGVEPLIIAIGARLALGEKMSRRAQWAMGISILGFVILGTGGEAPPHLWTGIAWALFAYALFSILVVANRIFVRHESPLVLTALEMIGAAPLAIYMTPGSWFPQDGVSWIYALSLGILCTGLAYVFYNTSMRVLSAPVAGLLLSLEVVYGISGGWLIGDSLNMRQSLAVVLVANILFFDIWAYLRARRAKGR